MKENLKYPMLIQWSEEDRCFLVGFPDFPGQIWRSHGKTHEKQYKSTIIYVN
nr:hypothetical protein [Spirulina major]